MARRAWSPGRIRGGHRSHRAASCSARAREGRCRASRPQAGACRPALPVGTGQEHPLPIGSEGAPSQAKKTALRDLLWARRATRCCGAGCAVVVEQLPRGREGREHEYPQGHRFEDGATCCLQRPWGTSRSRLHRYAAYPASARSRAGRRSRCRIRPMLHQPKCVPRHRSDMVAGDRSR
jgi:hypothetical protein